MQCLGKGISTPAATPRSEHNPGRWHQGLQASLPARAVARWQSSQPAQRHHRPSPADSARCRASTVGSALPPSDGAGQGGLGGGGSEGSGGSPWPLALVSFILALLVAAGGIMGYRKKGSTASLVSSGSFALVLVLAGSLMGNPEQALTGIRIAFGTSLVLGGYMGWSYTKSQKGFPHGVFAALSLTTAAGYASQLL